MEPWLTETKSQKDWTFQSSAKLWRQVLEQKKLTLKTLKNTIDLVMC